MKLEDAIKQNKFKSESEKAFINVYYTSEFLSNMFKKRYKDFNVTRQQFNVLRILRGSNPTPLSTKEICSRMINKMSDAPKIVDRLCLKGLTQKSVSKTDKRLVDVTISKKGLEMLSEMDAVNQKMNTQEFPLSDAECLKLNNLLDKLRTIDV